MSISGRPIASPSWRNRQASLTLFCQGLSEADMFQSLAADATITDLVRHRATELARDWK